MNEDVTKYNQNTKIISNLILAGSQPCDNWFKLNSKYESNRIRVKMTSLKIDEYVWIVNQWKTIQKIALLFNDFCE